jgi:Holliday junction resolvase
MTFRKRADSNQAVLVLELRTAGYEVIDYHAAGHGVPDIVMGRAGHYEWVEIKASRRSNLTDAERAFFAHCPGGPPILAWTAALAIAEFERRYAQISDNPRRGY